MNPNKVDVATEADWTFYSNTAVVRAVKGAARIVSDRFGDTDLRDDLEQDAYLFLAVRPDMVANYLKRGSDGMKALQWRIHRYLYERAERDAIRANRLVSSDALEVGSESL